MQTGMAEKLVGVESLDWIILFDERLSYWAPVIDIVKQFVEGCFRTERAAVEEKPGSPVVPSPFSGPSIQRYMESPLNTRLDTPSHGSWSSLFHCRPLSSGTNPWFLVHPLRLCRPRIESHPRALLRTTTSVGQRTNDPASSVLTAPVSVPTKTNGISIPPKM